MASSVEIATSEGVTTVTLQRPHALNALDEAATRQLTDFFEGVDADPATRVVVLTGAGRAFCAGADVADMVNRLGADPTPAQVRDMVLATSGRAARALYRTEKPVIAAVNGAAAGAGAAIAITADVTLMAESAILSFLFVRRGLVPDFASTWLLPRLVGLRTARRLCLTGDKVDAYQALELGLIDRVVGDDELLAQASETARRLATGPAVALRLTKRLLAESFDVDHATAVDREFSAQALCFASDDVREGTRAFLEKREPQFQGR